MQQFKLHSSKDKLMKSKGTKHFHTSLKGQNFSLTQWFYATEEFLCQKSISALLSSVAPAEEFQKAFRT